MWEVSPSHAIPRRRPRRHETEHDGWCSDGEVLLHRSQQPAVRVVRVSCHEERRPRRTQDADGAAASILGASRPRLVEVADRQHRRSRALRERHEGRESPTNIVIAIGVDGATKEGNERVEDHQSCADLSNRPLDGGEVVGNGGERLERERTDAVEG